MDANDLRHYAAMLGRAGGRAGKGKTSPRKAATSAANGKLGGRPRKAKTSAANGARGGRPAAAPRAFTFVLRRTIEQEQTVTVQATTDRAARAAAKARAADWDDAVGATIRDWIGDWRIAHTKS